MEKDLDKIEKITHNFKLERYKFILQQINSLNESTHKFLTIYQTLASAILGGGIAIVVSWRELNIDSTIAQLGIRATVTLFTLLTLFVIISIIINAISWFDYRKEEVELLSEEVGTNFRQVPNWKNSWRWSETYFVIFLLLIIIVVWIFTEMCLIPIIKE